MRKDIALLLDSLEKEYKKYIEPLEYLQNSLIKNIEFYNISIYFQKEIEESPLNDDFIAIKENIEELKIRKQVEILIENRDTGNVFEYLLKNNIIITPEIYAIIKKQIIYDNLLKTKDMNYLEKLTTDKKEIENVCKYIDEKEYEIIKKKYKDTDFTRFLIKASCYNQFTDTIEKLKNFVKIKNIKRCKSLFKEFQGSEDFKNSLETEYSNLAMKILEKSPISDENIIKRKNTIKFLDKEIQKQLNTERDDSKNFKNLLKDIKRLE